MSTPTDNSNESNAADKRQPNWLFRLIRALAIGYMVLLCVLPFLQTYLIFPGMWLRPANPAPMNSDGIEPLTLQMQDGSKVAAMFCRAIRQRGNPDSLAPTIIYFYGNASSMACSEVEIELFRRCGANVLLADYPGFGASTGQPSEESIYAMADALWNYALTRSDVDPHRIISVGWSIGGAVAVELAQRRPIAGLMTVSTFTSMQAMAHRQLPYMPTNLFLRYHFSNIDKMSSIHCPVVIVHGSEDQIVPEEMSHELAAVCSPFLYRFLTVQNAEHNDIFSVGFNEISAALVDLLSLADQPHATVK